MANLKNDIENEVDKDDSNMSGGSVSINPLRMQ